MAADAVLTAEGLAVGRAGRTVAAGIELAIAPGEVVAVLGPNGAGKSTLLATLAGLIEPLAGSVSTHGRVAAALQAPALARRSVLANVEAALAWWGVERAQRSERALAALARLRVEGLAGREARTLSGGEARRVHLARAIALRADVLALDEPFAGLDAPTRADLLRDARGVLRDPERATLVVLHDRAEAWALADRVVVLLDGAMAAAGELRDVLERPRSEAVAGFLGFSGRIATNGSVRRLRPSQVAFDAAGDLTGVVTRRIPEEDGVLCEVEVPGGAVYARHAYPGPEEGERVHLRAAPGVEFAG